MNVPLNNEYVKENPWAQWSSTINTVLRVPVRNTNLLVHPGAQLGNAAITRATRAASTAQMEAGQIQCELPSVTSLVLWEGDRMEATRKQNAKGWVVYCRIQCKWVFLSYCTLSSGNFLQVFAVELAVRTHVPTPDWMISKGCQILKGLIVSSCLLVDERLMDSGMPCWQQGLDVLMFLTSMPDLGFARLLLG